MIKFSAKSSGWPTRKGLEDLAEAQVKAYAGSIFRAAVRLSPVDSGAFRASWRISLNVARDDVTAGRPGNAIRGASFRWPTGFKLGDTFIISNNQPYAEELERGHSKQAPYGVLSLAVASASMP